LQRSIPQLAKAMLALSQTIADVLTVPVRLGQQVAAVVALVALRGQGVGSLQSVLGRALKCACSPLGFFAPHPLAGTEPELPALCCSWPNAEASKLTGSMAMNKASAART